MARRDALVRLHQSLTARRSELYKRLGYELADLGGNSRGSSDSADAAFDAGTEELSSKLAELEARELRQIERALTKMKQGSFGSCELCHTRIPVERLNALPYSTMCIKCQRDVENSDDWEYNSLTGNWESLNDGDGFDDRRHVDLSAMEVDYSK